MGTIDINDIPDDLRSGLDEIADRLISGHVAVMVGSGFSKNAHKSVSTAKDLPDWNQLGDIFYKELHGTIPGDECRYLNTMKLAFEVEAKYDRDKLGQILRDNIPDAEHEPSHLHTHLLNLPWVDVLTTNYDTLLERASDMVYTYHYTPVISAEDLNKSSRPRIIKLHGSFSSNRFVITDDDYRRYPRDYAAFVNTVQQILLENDLCMIGFSGEDPNFLNWIGWIRDNLNKEKMPKIYLVDLCPSNSMIQSHMKRNTSVINMGLFSSVKGNYYEALNYFLEYLRCKVHNTNIVDWPNTKQTNDTDALSCLNSWKEQHTAYPQWVVLPRDNRDNLSYNIQLNSPYKHLSSIQHTELDIIFLYELNWRLERALFPIPNNYIEHYERILNFYNPYPDSIEISSAAIRPNVDKYKELIWDTITEQWVHLHFALLRYFREEHHVDKWNKIQDRISAIKQHLTSEETAQWCYETCLYKLFSFDLESLRRELDNWPVNDNMPFWEAKRAGLIAEVGEIDKSERILENALSKIRQNQRNSELVNDYEALSQESAVMIILFAVKQSSMFSSREYKDISDIQKEYKKRFEYFKQYNCDYWDEISYFDILLNEPIKKTYSAIRKYEFDIGNVRNYHHYEAFDKSTITGYAFLRFCEEIGLPYVLSNLTIVKKQASNAYKRIAEHSPYWALITMLRLGEKDLADVLFDRNALKNVSIQDASKCANELIDMLIRCNPDIEKIDTLEKTYLAIRVAHVVPEILSRLCTKCSLETLDNILDLLKRLYESPDMFKYHGISNLMKRWIESSPDKYLCSKLKILLEFPIVKDSQNVLSQEYPDPFSILNIGLLDNIPPESLQVEDERIEFLLTKAQSDMPSERNASCLRLFCIYRANIMKEEQIARFIDVLWSKRGNDGFPQCKYLLKRAYFERLYPQDNDPIALFKQYIANARFPIHAASNSNGISMTGGRSLFCDELIWASRRPILGGIIDWSQEEAISILDRLLEWWNLDKEQLRKDTSTMFGDVRAEFHARFQNMIIIIADVITPRLSIETNDDIKHNLLSLLKELDDYEVPSLRVRAACLHIYPEDKGPLFKKIFQSISASEYEKVVDSLWGIFNVIRESRNTVKPDLSAKLLDTLAQTIKWRVQPALADSLNMFGNVVIYIPELLYDDLIAEVLTGLEYLLDESNIQTIESNDKAAEMLRVRVSSVSLASKLYDYYKSQNKEVPSVILKWEEIGESPYEFSDVRNKWNVSNNNE